MKYHIQKDTVNIEQKYEYINEVYPNGSHQYEMVTNTEKSIYC